MNASKIAGLMAGCVLVGVMLTIFETHLQDVRLISPRVQAKAPSTGPRVQASCFDTLSQRAHALLAKIVLAEADLSPAITSAKALVHPNPSTALPSTSLECVTHNTSDPAGRFPVCALTNVYYHSGVNAYLTLRGPPDVQAFLATLTESHDAFNDVREPRFVPDLLVPELAILAQPPHNNYCHGFLEELSCRFWETTVMQGRTYGINPDKLVFWISRSALFDLFPHNWDGLIFDRGMATTRYVHTWRRDMHSLLSSFPLGFSAHPDLQGKVVHFAKIIIPRFCGQRTVFVNRAGMHDPSRSFKYTPFTRRAYGRWMMLFGDYILRRHALASRFSNATRRLEHILISPRKGAGQREMLNGEALLEALPHPSRLVEFTSMLEAIHALSSTRLLISPHGAGLSNIIFMRIGSSVLETDSYLCDSQGDFYGALAESVGVSHRVWAEKFSPYPRASCEPQASITLDIPEVCREVGEVLTDQEVFMNALVHQALDRMMAP